eukprot:5985552-Pleurochrysis_carterae.AAC.1
MPIHFQVLSRLSFTAQQLLLPRTVHFNGENVRTNVDECIRRRAAGTIWRDYYLSKSTARCLSTAIDTKVLLGSDDVVPPDSSFAPPNVRSYHSPTVGIWHPDKLLPGLIWDGGKYNLDSRGGYFNPFAELPDALL